MDRRAAYLNGGPVSGIERRQRVLALTVIGAVLVGCSEPSGDVAADPADVTDVEDIDEVDEEPDPAPEPQAEPELGEDPAEGSAGDPEADAEPDAEAGPEPGEYDGYPIDQPVEDVSVIDAAYVEEVLRVLDDNYVSVVRRVQERDPEDATAVEEARLLKPLAMTFSESDEQAALARIVDFEQRGGFRREPSAVDTSVARLLSVGRGCLSAEVTRNADPLYEAPLNGTWYVVLAQRPFLADEAGTVWRYAGEVPSTGEVVDGCG